MQQQQPGAVGPQQYAAQPQQQPYGQAGPGLDVAVHKLTLHRLFGETMRRPILGISQELGRKKA
eukprot:1551936-Amphidinium_carterae.1